MLRRQKDAGFFGKREQRRVLRAGSRDGAWEMYRLGKKNKEEEKEEKKKGETRGENR